MNRNETKLLFGPGWRELLLFLLAGFAIFCFLSQWGSGASWLRVEGPDRAIIGKQIQFHVKLGPVPDAGYLCADLHWAGTHDKSNGYLSSGGAKQVDENGGVFDFEMEVPQRDGLQFVHGIFFLSSTPDWEDHTLVASTDLIPTTTNNDLEASTLGRLPVHPLEKPQQTQTPPSSLPRWLIGFVLLLASILAWRASPSVSTPGESLNQQSGAWVVLALALAFATLWEFFGMANWIGAEVRSFAHSEDVYYVRANFQKITISLIIAAALVFARIAVRDRTLIKAVLLPLALYSTVVLVNLLSLHSIDKIASLSWRGATLAQLLELICAGFILIGVWACRNSTARGTLQDTTD